MFIKQAYKGENQFWRYIVGIIVLIAALFMGQIPLGVLLFIENAKGSGVIVEEVSDLALLGYGQNLILALMLIPFAVGFFSLMFISKQIHRRPFITLLTGFSKFRWKRFFMVILIWLLFLFVTELISYYMEPDNYQVIFNAKKFIPLVFITFLLIPLQAGLEEVFIRGYLMQGIGILTKYRIIPLILTSLTFGLLHFANPEVDKFGTGTMLTYYCTFGLFLGIITLMDEGLEIPLGIHVINNLYGSLVVTFDGSALQTPAAFKILEINPQVMLYMWLGSAVVLLLLFTRIFKWKNYYKLFQKI